MMPECPFAASAENCRPWERFFGCESAITREAGTYLCGFRIAASADRRHGMR